MDVAKKFGCEVNSQDPNKNIDIKFQSVVRFRQEVLFKDSIDKRVELRQSSKTKFEKNFHKLSMNSPFGKTCEDKRKRRDYKVANNNRLNKKYGNSVRKVWWKRINENCVIYHMLKKSITLDKPIYLGWAILQLSKYHMYSTFYNILKPKFGDDMKLCMMDTDSFILKIDTDDVYKNLMELDNQHNFMDWSNYPLTHPVFDGMTDEEKLNKTKNENLTGFFKDESKGLPVYEYAGLRSKMYSYQLTHRDLLSELGLQTIGNDRKGDSNYDENKLEECKSKGVSDKDEHKDYVEMALFMERGGMMKENIVKEKDIYSFRSFNHKVFTQIMNKTTLCCFDDKRVLMPDGIHTYALGHYKVEEYKMGLRYWDKDKKDLVLK